MDHRKTTLLLALALLAPACTSSEPTSEDGDQASRAPESTEQAVDTSAAETVAEVEPIADPAPPAPEPTLEVRTLGEVRNLHVHGDVYLAGQPTPADFELLRDAGVRTVINIRPQSEQGEFDEAAHVESLGLTYVHLPFNSPDGMTDELIDEIRLQLSDPEAPVLLHCASANRVGALWIAHRTLDHGLTHEQALAEAKEVGLRSEALATRAHAYITTKSQSPH